jgi:hypothetical protein
MDAGTLEPPWRGACCPVSSPDGVIQLQTNARATLRRRMPACRFVIHTIWAKLRFMHLLTDQGASIIKKRIQAGGMMHEHKENDGAQKQKQLANESVLLQPRKTTRDMRK